jgi:hypothetical protein
MRFQRVWKKQSAKCVAAQPWRTSKANYAPLRNAVVGSGEVTLWVIRDLVETTADHAISGIPRLLPVLAMQPKFVMCQKRKSRRGTHRGVRGARVTRAMMVQAGWCEINKRRHPADSGANEIDPKR